MAHGFVSLWLLVLVFLDATDWTFPNGARAQDFQQQTNEGLKGDFLKGPSDRHSDLKRGLKRQRNGAASVEGQGSVKGAGSGRATSLDEETLVKGAYPGIAGYQKTRKHRAGLKRQSIQRQYAAKRVIKSQERRRLQAVRETGLKGRAVLQEDLSNKLAPVPDSQLRNALVPRESLRGKSAPNQDLQSKYLPPPDARRGAQPVQQTDLKRIDLSKDLSSKSESRLKTQQSAPALQRSFERNRVHSQDQKSEPSQAQKSLQAAVPFQQTGLKTRAFKKGLESKTSSVLKSEKKAAASLNRGPKRNHVPNQDSESENIPFLKTPRVGTAVQRAGLKGNYFKKGPSRDTAPLLKAQQRATPSLQGGAKSNPVPKQDRKSKSLPVQEALQGAEPAKQTGLKGTVLETLASKTASVPERQQGAVPPIPRKGSSVSYQGLESKTIPASKSLLGTKSGRQAGFKGATPNKSFRRKPAAPQEVYQRPPQVFQRGPENNRLPNQGQNVNTPLVHSAVGGVKQQRTGVKGRMSAKDLYGKSASTPQQQKATSDLQAEWGRKPYPSQVSDKNSPISNAQQRLQLVPQTGLKGRSAPNQSLNRNSAPLLQAQGNANPDRINELKERTSPNQGPKASVLIQAPQQVVELPQETQRKRNLALKPVYSKTASAVVGRQGGKQAPQLGQFPTQGSNYRKGSSLNGAPATAAQTLQAGNLIEQETAILRVKTAEQAGLKPNPTGKHAEELVREQAASSHINRNVNQSLEGKTSHLVSSNIVRSSGTNVNPVQDMPVQQTQGHSEKFVPPSNRQTLLHGNADTSASQQQPQNYHSQQQLQVPNRLTTSGLQGQQRQLYKQQAPSRPAAPAVHQEPPYLQQHQRLY